MPGPSIIWYLKRMELLDDMDEEELLELGKHLKHGQVQKGDPIYLPGQPSNAIYFLKEGRIKLSRLTGEGRPITLDILEPGDIFGEIAHTEHLRGETVAEAMEDSFLCEMRRETFLMLLKSKPEFALRVVELMDGRRQRFEVRLDELLYKDVATRLARLLLRLSDQYGTVGRDGVHLRLGLSHEELANLIATTRETLSKFMSEFRSRGLIDYGAGQILLLDLPALQEQAT